jgi:hypothetical protein
LGLALLALPSCRPSPPVYNGAANANVVNINVAANTSAPVAPVNANAPVAVAPVPVNSAAPVAAPGKPVPAREPEQYRASLTLKLANRTVVTADIARNGTDRRLDFKLPDGTKLVYLYQTDRLFLILPDKKIYAEQEGPAGGFTLPSTLDPERLVQQLQADARYEPAGESKFNNRAAAKYRYTGGIESFVFVDKETSLPLQVEMAQPKGGEAVKATVEIGGLTDDIPLKHFNEPRDMQQVEIGQLQSVFARILQAAGV